MLNLEAPSAHAESRASTPRAALDRVVAEVGEQRRAFARMPAAEKAAMLRATLPILVRVGRAWAEAGCRAKGISLERNIAGEEWLGGPLVTARNLRLLIHSLEQISHKGRPVLGHGVRTRSDGRLEIEVLPAGGFDSALYRGLSCVALMDPGIDESSARERQAAFYQKKDPEGGVSARARRRQRVVDPRLGRSLQDVRRRPRLRAQDEPRQRVGRALSSSSAWRPSSRAIFCASSTAAAKSANTCASTPASTTFTSPARTRRTIASCGGRPGPSRIAARRENDPLLKKTITSELGNVSPVAIVPGNYTDQELDFQARSVVTMIANNASFNCNAAKMLVTSRSWPQRGRFLERNRDRFGEVPPRKAYYPGAARATAICSDRAPT